MTDQSINWLQQETKNAYHYLGQCFNNINLPNQGLKVMQHWSPIYQDPEYQDMGADTVTLYCYPNGITYAVTGTQNGASFTYKVEGLKAALFLIEYLTDESVQMFYTLNPTAILPLDLLNDND